MNMIATEKSLRNYVDYLCDTGFPLKKTEEHIWGKEVIIPQLEDGRPYTIRQELRNWHITFTFDDSWSIPAIVEKVKAAVKEKERIELLGVPDRYVCYQLCDWCWLEDSCGNIIKEVNKGVYKVTIVKYAFIGPQAEEVTEQTSKYYTDKEKELVRSVLQKIVHQDNYFKDSDVDYTMYGYQIYTDEVDEILKEYDIDMERPWEKKNV